VLEYVDQLLGDPGAAPSTQEPIVLAHKIDEIPARSRSRHIFARQGFTMINLPVRVIPEKASALDEERWSHVVDGLPSLTAADLERRGDWEAVPWRLRKETEPRPAKRPPRKASAASGREGVET
jgi:hypothetical protein